MADEVAAALEKLIRSVVRRAKRLDRGKDGTFYVIKGGSVTVCGILRKKEVVGLHLVSVGRVYEDPEKRLVAKSWWTGHMLWLRGIDDVPTARPFIEQAFAQAKAKSL